MHRPGGGGEGAPLPVAPGGLAVLRDGEARQARRLRAVRRAYKSLESWELTDGTQLGCVDTGEWLYESNKTATVEHGY